MKRFAALTVVLALFVSPVGADDTSVSLRDHVEALMEQQDRYSRQQRQDDRQAIETALRSEIRIKDEESKSRYALKVEMNELRDITGAQQARIAELEGSRVTQYIGILILTALGIINLVGPFWRGK